MRQGSNLEQLPLRPAIFHILLALSEADRHGLGIADEVTRTSEGAIQLGPGTLYRSLDELRDQGLIEKAPAPTESADPRRKYYRITSGGRALLRLEVARLQRVVAHASGAVLPERA